MYNEQNAALCADVLYYKRGFPFWLKGYAYVAAYTTG